MPSKTGPSDRRTRLTFKDQNMEKEYKQIMLKARVLSYLSFLLLFAALDAVLTDIILLAAVIPAAAATVILQYRYNNRLMELQNSDEVRWET